jgi:Flp pilus assembly protein TadD/TolB-like protein
VSLILFCLSWISSAAAADATVLVFPLENRAGLQLAWVGESLALSITEQIRMPGIAVIDRDDRLDYLERADLPPNLPLSIASMIRVGQLASADYIVTGHYSGKEDRLDVRLQALDLRTMRRGGEVSASGPLSALPQMENELAYNAVTNAGLNRTLSREAFKQRTRRMPNTAVSQFVASLETQDEEEQILALKRAISIHPDFPEALFRLGRYYYDAGNCDSAVRYLEPARKSPSRYLASQFMLGVCYLKREDHAEAVRSFSSIADSRPSVAVLNNLGVAELRQGDYAVATQHLLDAGKLSRSDPAVALNLAILRYLQGNMEAARSVLERIETVHPNRPLVLYLLSRVFESFGENEKAAAALANARRFGADPAQLGAENPKQWCRLFDVFDQK